MNTISKTDEHNIPRLLISASRSGEGKTSVALGINRALRKRGLVVQPWKAGPDYLDPGYHSLAAGRICRNLDTWMLSADVNKSLFLHGSEDSDIALVEGVMGYFDGSSDGSGSGSSEDLARVLSLPVVLVLDVSSMAQSAGAIAAGFIGLDSTSMISGFILNRVAGARHQSIVTGAVEDATGLPVFGVLPRRTEIILPERHLGLVSARTNPKLEATIEALSRIVEEHIDLDSLVVTARSVDPLAEAEAVCVFPGAVSEAVRPKIAYALDDAFHFYYQDNLDYLSFAGGDLVPFSPLSDSYLPACDALYIGGGYPEVYAEILSANHSMLKSIRSAVKKGLPVFAECGGYMYLSQAIIDGQNRRYPMTGILAGEVHMGDKLRRLGYCEISVQKESFLGQGTIFARGHLFHYSRMDGVGDVESAYLLRKTGETDCVKEGQVKGSVCAGYTHVHFASNPQLPKNFVTAAILYKKGRNPDGATVSES